MCNRVNISRHARSYGLDELDLKLIKFINFRHGFFIEAGNNEGIAQSNIRLLGDKLGWSEFAISINVKNVEKLPEIINAHTKEMIKKKQDKIRKIYCKYFTMEGTCNQIIDMLKGEYSKKMHHENLLLLHSRI